MEKQESLVKEQCEHSPVEFIPLIITQVGLNVDIGGDTRLDRWVSNHATWEQICDSEMQNVIMNQGVAELNHHIPDVTYVRRSEAAV